MEKFNGMIRKPLWVLGCRNCLAVWLCLAVLVFGSGVSVVSAATESSSAPVPKITGPGLSGVVSLELFTVGEKDGYWFYITPKGTWGRGRYAPGKTPVQASGTVDRAAFDALCQALVRLDLPGLPNLKYGSPGQPTITLGYADQDHVVAPGSVGSPDPAAEAILGRYFELTRIYLQAIGEDPARLLPASGSAGAVLPTSCLDASGALLFPVRVSVTQGGAVGFTGHFWAVEPDGTWKCGRVVPICEDKVQASGTIDPSAMARLGAELDKHGLLTLETHSRRQANPNDLGVSFGNQNWSFDLQSSSTTTPSGLEERFQAILAAVKAVCK